MSAIYGIYDLADKNISEEEALILENSYKDYKFDQESSLRKDNFFMGIKKQFFTEESKREVLPYYDKEDKLIIVADAVIDNRKELIDELSLNNQITDSQIILESYKKWSYDVGDYLIGDFAFIIYDELKEEIFAATDHVGKRSLFYCLKNNKFSFSTLLNPLAEYISKIENINLNEKWIIDYLAIEGAISSINLNETIYHEIKQIPPAHCLLLNKEGISLKQYWHPEKIKEVKLSSDDAYIAKFKEIFKEAIDCRLRATKNIGIMLSSGLDSTAVAAFAANDLKEQGKELYSFTWIPIKNYQSNLSKSQIVDESSTVKEFINQYDNIRPSFCSFEGKNSYDNINDLLEVFGMPYKFVENAYWVNEIIDRAVEKNCNVILDGQFGNFTISKGNFISYIYTLSKKMKLKTINNEINKFSELYGGDKHVARRVLSKDILKNNKLIKQFLKVKNKDYKETYESLANPALKEMWHTDERLSDIGLSIDDNKILDCDEVKKYITNLVLFSHMGAIETEISLTKGVLRRDPTRDKRVIEFCLSLPENQFVNDGKERILVRRALKGMVTDKILDNYFSRGKQSADWLERLADKMDSILAEADEIATKSKVYKYINIEYYKKLINDVKVADTYDSLSLRKLMIVLILNRYLQKGI